MPLFLLSGSCITPGEVFGGWVPLFIFVGADFLVPQRSSFFPCALCIVAHSLRTKGSTVYGTKIGSMYNMLDTVYGTSTLLLYTTCFPRQSSLYRGLT